VLKEEYLAMQKNQMLVICRRCTDNSVYDPPREGKVCARCGVNIDITTIENKLDTLESRTHTLNRDWH